MRTATRERPRRPRIRILTSHENRARPTGHEERVLEALTTGRHPTLSAKEIASQVGLSIATVVDALNSMERTGQVLRLVSDEKGRARWAVSR